ECDGAPIDLGQAADKRRCDVAAFRWCRRQQPKFEKAAGIGQLGNPFARRFASVFMLACDARLAAPGKSYLPPALQLCKKGCPFRVMWSSHNSLPVTCFATQPRHGTLSQAPSCSPCPTGLVEKSGQKPRAEASCRTQGIHG